MDFHIKYGSPGYVHNRGTLLLCVILEVEIVYSFHVIFATDLNLEKLIKIYVEKDVIGQIWLYDGRNNF